jgi:hypothetical protein
VHEIDKNEPVPYNDTETMPCVITLCTSAVKRTRWIGFAILLCMAQLAPAQQRYVVVWGGNFFGQTNVPPGLGHVAAIAAGHQHCLALRSDGKVVAWGDNTGGQTNVPASVTNAMAIAAGEYHSVALRSNGTVVAWGLNGSGQLNVPPSLSGVVAVSAGRSHSLALRSNGTVVAWGNNFEGQTNVPPGLTNVVAVSAGDTHSLALRANGTIEAWGDNASGQCNTPSSVTNARAISAGYHHNLAIRSNGTVVAWELNVYGESTVPLGLSNVMAVSASYFSSAALQSNGTVTVWGETFSGKTDVPAGLSNFVAISAGSDHLMALTNGMPDDFAGRLPIVGSNIANLALSNIGATAEPDEPSHSSLLFNSPDSSIWLTWTAPFSGGAALSATASFLFPVIAVYTGANLSTLSPVVENTSGFNQSRVVFNAVAGTTYQIAIDNAGGGSPGAISFDLQLTAPPLNDAFANRIPIVGSFFETAGSFIGATKELGEPSHASFNGDPAFQQTLWWTWTAPTNVGVVNIPVSVTADAVSFPPNIGVYTGTAVPSLNNVTVSSLTNGMTRVTTFTAVAGTTYHIALGGEHYDRTLNNLAVRYGNYRLRLNMRALVLGMANLNVTNNPNETVSFGATAQVTNYGSAGSNPLRVRASAVSGVSVRGPDTGYVVNTNYILYVTNLIALSPGQGRTARIFGTLPAPFEDPTDTQGIGYGAYAELQEQFGSNWHTIDQTVVGFGDWPSLGGFDGPGGGVIRLDPGLTGSAFIPLTNVSVLGPAVVLEGTTTAYTGRARYSDGSQINFTNTLWTATRFSITNGLFSAGITTSNTPVGLSAKYSWSGFVYDAATNITVSDLPPPQLGQASVGSGLFSLQVQGVANRKHAIDTTTNLSAPVIWLPLTTNALGANGVLNVTNSIGTIPRRFYRAREVE